MIDYLLIVLLLGIVAGVVFYLYRQKKRGAACIGCPYAKECAKKRAGSCSCGSTQKNK